MTWLEQLRERRGLTYLMITHDMRAVARYAPRVAVMAGGRVVATGRPAEIFARTDVLAECGIIAPPIARLHLQLAAAADAAPPGGCTWRSRVPRRGQAAAGSGLMAHFLTGSLLSRSIVAYLIVFVVPLVLPVIFIKLIGLGGIRDLLAYEPKDTVLHRLDPRLRLIYLGVVGILRSCSAGSRC